MHSKQYANITKNCFIYSKLVYIHLRPYIDDLYNDVSIFKCKLKILKDI